VKVSQKRWHGLLRTAVKIEKPLPSEIFYLLTTLPTYYGISWLSSRFVVPEGAAE
jgi:hypothetical protein